MRKNIQEKLSLYKVNIMNGNDSSVMSGIMVKNSARWLPAFFKQVENMTYPDNKLRLVFSYGNSNDKTLDLIKEYKEKSKYKVEVFAEPQDRFLKMGGAQCAAAIYKDFQQLLDEDYFLLLDSDLTKIPPNLIQELMRVQADIVAPYTWSENKRHFYDNFIFRIQNLRFSPQDPPGNKLTYPIRVGSCGCCFLADGKVWKETEIANPYPNLTFCYNAARAGALVAAVPYLECEHVDLEKYGINHMPLHQKYGGWPSAEAFLTSDYIVEPVPLRD